MWQNTPVNSSKQILFYFKQINYRKLLALPGLQIHLNFWMPSLFLSVSIHWPLLAHGLNWLHNLKNDIIEFLKIAFIYQNLIAYWVFSILFFSRCCRRSSCWDCSCSWLSSCGGCSSCWCCCRRCDNWLCKIHVRVRIRFLGYTFGCFLNI